MSEKREKYNANVNPNPPPSGPPPISQVRASDKDKFTARQVDDLLGEVHQLQAQLDAATEVADRQRERAKQAEFLANERAKALALVRAECAAWRREYERYERTLTRYEGGWMTEPDEKYETDAANALETP